MSMVRMEPVSLYSSVSSHGCRRRLSTRTASTRRNSARDSSSIGRSGPSPPTSNSSTWYPCCRSTSEALAIRCAKYQRVTYGTTTPTTIVLPVARLDAVGEATYCSSAAADSTRCRVLSLTIGSPRSARDTVAVDTPAACATSSILLTAPAAGECRSGSPLQATSQQASDEVALQRQEHHERHENRDERAGRQQVPGGASRAAEVGERHGDRRDLRRPAREGEGDQEVVPHPQELEDTERRDGVF